MQLHLLRGKDLKKQQLVYQLLQLLYELVELLQTYTERISLQGLHNSRQIEMRFRKLQAKISFKFKHYDKQLSPWPQQDTRNVAKITGLHTGEEV